MGDAMGFSNVVFNSRHRRAPYRLPNCVDVAIGPRCDGALRYTRARRRSMGSIAFTSSWRWFSRNGSDYLTDCPQVRRRICGWGLRACRSPDRAAEATSSADRESQVALWLGCGIYGLGWLLPVYWSWHDRLDAQTHFTMLCYYSTFAVVHSGGAALRARIVPWIGERLYRVAFALVSLPMAGSTVAYFLVHRRDGIAFAWLQQQLPSAIPHFHEVIWLTSAVSFLFLYPATLDLAQVAAIARPTVRLYDTGIIRITRHPQLWGQIMWCLAHSAWIGSSMAITISCALIGHHFIAAWHGDRRLQRRFGALEWSAFSERASLWPFWSILQGKQPLGRALMEICRPAYLGVLLFVYGAYRAHPLLLHWANETTLFR